MIRIEGSRIGALALGVLVVLGVGAQTPPPAPKPQETKPAQVAPPPDEPKDPGAGLPAPVDPKTFRIGAQDVLKITVWREQDLGGMVGVRPDGMVTLNLLGEIPVIGLTPLEFQSKLKEKYADLVNNPIVTVEVMSVRSKYYYVTGNVGHGGQFPLVLPTTMLEALTLAGGPGEFANKKKIVIMRGAKRLNFNYSDVIKGKNLDQNIYVESGDFIIVK